jgi:hypothetical protein
MTTINLRTLGLVARLADQSLAGTLLAWRDRMVAAFGVPEGAVAFIVPAWALTGVTHLAGSPVVHSGDVSVPVVALAPDGPSGVAMMS